MAFNLTNADINLSNNLAFISTIPGTCISFIALVAYTIIACIKRTRANLNRVSFRLMVYTLVFNVLFGIAYAATPASPGPLCNFGAFVVNFTLSFSTFFTTCIALNLQLVLVHGVNGQRMEKYYIIATTVLSIGLNVPAFGLHQFGFNEDTGTCWLSNPDPKTRLKWIIGVQSFWITLAATVETVCSCVVLAWIYRFQRVTAIMIKLATGRNPPKIEQKTEITSSEKRFRPVMLVAQDKRYRRVVLRIAMYPIVSLIVNYTTVILDLNTTINNINNQRDFNLLILDLIFYGARPLAYGLLAVTDPAIIKAVRELRASKVKSTNSGNPSEGTHIDFAPGSQHPTTRTLGASSITAKDTVHSLTEQSGTEASIGSRPDLLESGNIGTEISEELRNFEAQL
ncbi:hypothetical protein BDQ17DRAFT_1301453 [Cyathus striatus]|nr:hypothetical protein BDQ17DRAFT_1301453 [Cyathus striatus]